MLWEAEKKLLIKDKEKNMKKTLKVEIFSDADSLCSFVNRKHITQENIQAITSVCTKPLFWDTLYYWEFEEEKKRKRRR